MGIGIIIEDPNADTTNIPSKPKFTINNWVLSNKFGEVMSLYTKSLNSNAMELGHVQILINICNKKYIYIHHPQFLMTELLYLNDCYAKEFEGEIVAVEGNKVELNRTLFYYTGGGQPNDKGQITSEKGDFSVVDVKKEDGRIWNYLDKEGLAVGDKIKGTIDWKKRYRMMQYHTACHQLSAVVHKATGALITGNNIDENDKARIDFNLETFDREGLKAYEEEVNKVFRSNLPVNIRYFPREVALKMPEIERLAAGLPKEISEIRVIEVEGFDQQACGGTHVKNTGEIPKLEIYKAENKGKKNRRVYFRLAMDTGQ